MPKAISVRGEWRRFKRSRASLGMRVGSRRPRPSIESVLAQDLRASQIGHSGPATDHMHLLARRPTILTIPHRHQRIGKSNRRNARGASKSGKIDRGKRRIVMFVETPSDGIVRVSVGSKSDGTKRAKGAAIR